MEKLRHILYEYKIGNIILKESNYNTIIKNIYENNNDVILNICELSNNYITDYNNMCEFKITTEELNHAHLFFGIEHNNNIKYVEFLFKNNTDNIKIKGILNKECNIWCPFDIPLPLKITVEVCKLMNLRKKL